MQIASSTRAASGSEHLFSHLWEMQGLTHNGENVPHGIQVGLGTIASSALLEWLLSLDLTRLPLDALSQAWPTAEQVEAEVRSAHPAGPQADQAVAETLAKHLSVAQLRSRIERVGQAWPTSASGCAAGRSPRALLSNAWIVSDARPIRAQSAWTSTGWRSRTGSPVKSANATRSWTWRSSPADCRSARGDLQRRRVLG